ncbi:MAG: SGNH/GDSL hydrolase family protein [Bacteroidota bacterium]
MLWAKKWRRPVGWPQSVFVLWSGLLMALLITQWSCRSEAEQFFPPEVPTLIDSTELSPSLPISINYLALGDSYTIGEDVDSTQRYPNLLAGQLQTAGLDVDSPTIIAQTGWTTRNLLQAIDAADLTDTFELVSLLIGVNNQYQGADFTIYESEFPQLLQKAIQLAGGDTENVFVLSIPDYAFTPFGQNWGNPNQTSEELDQYNAFNKSWTTAQGVVYFDITPISRQGLSDPTLVASDGLHPSGKMYQLWMDQIVEEVKSLLED